MLDKHLKKLIALLLAVNNILELSKYRLKKFQFNVNCVIVLTEISRKLYFTNEYMQVTF